MIIRHLIKKSSAAELSTRCMMQTDNRITGKHEPAESDKYILHRKAA